MSDAMIFGERRMHKRKACFFKAEVDADRHSFPEIEPRLGEVFLMTIPFRLRKRYLRIRGEIVRVRTEGLGVRFIKNFRH
ncbi:MAG: hypothetical protein P8X55_01130 [Desulfosarcinaceae bacterium]